MAQILRQSTAIDVRLGPAMDPTDGVTPVTGLTIGAADQAEVLKADGAATAAMAGTLAAVTGADGWYDYTCSTSDTDTVGTLEIVLQDASATLPLFKTFQVMDAVTYDTLYASSPTIITPADVGLVYESAITTVTGQTEFIMTEAFAVDDSWIGCEVSLYDTSTDEVYAGNIWISDAVTSTDSLHINAAFPVTVVAGDTIRIYARQHAGYALTTYDPPTRTEATADKAEILADALIGQQVLARSDAAIATDNSAKITAINADEGSGAGDYDPTVDSLEAQALFGLAYESTINIVTNQNNFRMTKAFAINNSWIGCEVSLYDVSNNQVFNGTTWITDSDAATDTLTLNINFPVTVVVGDILRVHARQHASYALDLYDPPTRTEATADKDEILVDTSAIKAKTDDLTFTKALELDVNIQSKNGTTLLGSGIISDKWRGS